MAKDTDKYTRNYSNFGSYPQPGKNLPAYYDYLKDAGDGSPGLQYMIQKAMGSYGNYHVIDGCEPTIDGTDITGSTGYVMWDGSIINVPSESEQSLSDGQYLVVNQNGGYGVTGAKPTGVIIAERIGSTIYHIARREDINSKNYFPYGIKLFRNIEGQLGNISGFEEISANTGIFKNIKGFSDINMQDSLDFANTYHLKGVSQITGISGNIQELTSDRLNRLLAIGSANKRWVNFGYMGTDPYDDSVIENNHIAPNTGTPKLWFELTQLPYELDDLNLKLTRLKIGIYAADVSNYIDTLDLYGMTDYNSVDPIESDTTNRSSATGLIWDIEDVTIGRAYENIRLQIQCSVATQGNLGISFVKGEYYYG